MTINEELLPKERKKNGFDIVTVLYLFMFVFTFICCYLYTMRLEVEVDHQKKEIAELQAKIEQEKKGFEDIKKLRKNIIELKNDIVFYNIGGQEIFGELSSLIPNNMKLNDISITFSKDHSKPSTLTLSGVVIEKQGTKPDESVSNFVKNIKKSKYFKNTTITNNPTKSKTTKDKYYWNIEIKYNDEV